MNKETTFLLMLIGIAVIACVGVGLVISAFVGRKFTKAGKIRAIIGGALIAVCTAIYFVFVR